MRVRLHMPAPRVGRILMWLLALAVVAFLLNGQRNINERAAAARSHLRAVQQQNTRLAIQAKAIADRTGDIATQARRDADTTRAALCALRKNLELQVAASKRFLRENPQGIPGISPRVIKDGMRRQQLTIKALSEIPCKPAYGGDA